MMHLFTIEQLAERGYRIWQEDGMWHFSLGDGQVTNHYTKETILVAASKHCRENYVPDRPEGVPDKAEFRLPKKGDTFRINDSTFKPMVCHKDYEPQIVCPYNGRRWCWREDENPKSVTSEICAISTITNEVWQETLSAMGKCGPIRNRYDACAMINEHLQTAWTEVRIRNHDAAKMRASLIQIAAQAVRAIHDAKGWEE